MHPFLALGKGTKALSPGTAPWCGSSRDEGLGLPFAVAWISPNFYAAMGAEVFLVGSAWPGEYQELLAVLARARAAENLAYLLLANRADTGNPSLAVAPDGRLLASRQ